MFSQKGKGDLNMSTQNRQAEVDAAIQRAKGLQDENANLKSELLARDHAAAVQRALLVIDKSVKDGCLLPAHTVGLAEFVAAQAGDSFSFSSADGKETKESPFEFALNFIGKLGKQIVVGARQDEPPVDTGVSSYSAPAGFTVDAERAALDAKARDYAAKNNVDYIVAYKAVGGA